ncbi:hypothetical protein MHBO_001710, partial [Bonamia ostreae]
KMSLSVALPGCILDKAQTPMLKAYLAGQIGRALTIFKIDEIVIFSENGCKIPNPSTKSKDPNLILYKLLCFLETPPYLRKALFPMSDDYKHVAVIKPLESLHHPLKHSFCKYREGVITENNGENSKVNVGYEELVSVEGEYKINERVSVRLKKNKRAGKIVSRKRLQKKTAYSGYSVRLANGLNGVFKNTPFKNGYDLTIGTSERGKDIRRINESTKLTEKKHALIVLGGPKGLENCLNAKRKKIRAVQNMFDHYVNAGIAQGSRTIRTEEAILIILTAFNDLCKT